jgi:DNA-binding transcriptional ArsR family regulator
MREDLDHFAARASEFLKILAGRGRTLVLWHLLEGEKSVSELGRATATSVAVTSQNLAVLRASRLVSRRREGQRVYYSLSDENMRHLIIAVLNMHAPSDRLGDVDNPTP